MKEGAVQDFIRNKLKAIYDDFEGLAKHKGCLCDCGSFTYAEGSPPPDYTNPLVQDHYLLRYLPAYLAEWWEIYDRLLSKTVIYDEINITSFGCGCGIDLWGLRFALQDRGLSLQGRVTYTGIDRIQWRHSAMFGGSTARASIKDVAEVQTLDPACNVVAFGRSLSEFDDSAFDAVCEAVRRTDFATDGIVLLATRRTTEKEKEKEGRRLRALSALLQERHGFCLRQEVEPAHDGGVPVGIRKICPGFIYPEDLLAKVKVLHSLCEHASQQGGFCEDCRFPQRESPVLTTKYYGYLGFCHERERRY
jgi:hypothetical protein